MPNPLYINEEMWLDLVAIFENRSHRSLLNELVRRYNAWPKLRDVAMAQITESNDFRIERILDGQD